MAPLAPPLGGPHAQNIIERDIRSYTHEVFIDGSSLIVEEGALGDSNEQVVQIDGAAQSNAVRYCRVSRLSPSDKSTVSRE